MKALHLIFSFLLLQVVSGQDSQLRNRIDSTILIIDNTSKAISFNKPEKSSNKEERIVRYQFKVVKGNLAYILRQFSERDSSVSQLFYLMDGSLIFSNESIIYYFGKDSIAWGGTYYFSNGKLKDYETLGHGKSEIETWNPQFEVFDNYRKAKADVLAYLKKKNGG